VAEVGGEEVAVLGARGGHGGIVMVRRGKGSGNE
jgi:hypothetical protein